LVAVNRKLCFCVVLEIKTKTVPRDVPRNNFRLTSIQLGTHPRRAPSMPPSVTKPGTACFIQAQLISRGYTFNVCIHNPYIFTTLSSGESTDTSFPVNINVILSERLEATYAKNAVRPPCNFIETSSSRKYVRLTENVVGSLGKKCEF
jgi:hypothetical protein